MAEKSDFFSCLLHPAAPRGIPRLFNNPFRYIPCEAVKAAAQEVMEAVESSGQLREAFGEGKMLGVLITDRGYLAGFSGNAGGKNKIEGFVPPIYNLLDPDGRFKKEEAVISSINSKISFLAGSTEYMEAVHLREEIENSKRLRLSMMKENMEKARAERKRIREQGAAEEVLKRLEKESQFENAEFRRTVRKFDALLAEADEKAEKFESRLERLHQERKSRSDALQSWIFRQFKVHNAAGKISDIEEIFRKEGIAPPSGTGECAAPKLLECAYRLGLRPLAIGEFWYGNSPDSEIRRHGCFYPSCAGKCGPLLRFMLQGLDMENRDKTVPDVRILHEDDSVIAVEKPAGMPAVPGKTGDKSLQEILGGVFSVHRLDMDTSGVMIFAKTEKARKILADQFATRKVVKEYMALLEKPPADARNLQKGETGEIRLPLAPDYGDRPRQKADRIHGKEAVTLFTVEDIRENGETLVSFRPLTGRTHQLRVHSAHPDGLGRPIKGDYLYGSPGNSGRLCLHAASITLQHPDTGETVKYECQGNGFVTE